SDHVITAAHESAQGADIVALRRQRREAMAIGAQQIGEQVGVAGIALGAVAAIARASCFDGIGMNGDDGETRVEQRIDDDSRRTLDGDGRTLIANERSLQLREARRAGCDIDALTDVAVVVDDAYRMGLAGPIESGKERGHRRAPASRRMTCRAGSPCGSLTDRRSWLRNLA